MIYKVKKWFFGVIYTFSLRLKQKPNKNKTKGHAHESRLKRTKFSAQTIETRA